LLYHPKSSLKILLFYYNLKAEKLSKVSPIISLEICPTPIIKQFAPEISKPNASSAPSEPK